MPDIQILQKLRQIHPSLKNLRGEHVLLFIVICVASWFAYKHHFIQDDAFISFRYAKNFADGNGLVWYPGSTEYGYTNFLFTILVALLMKVGVGVPEAAFIISVPAYLVSIYVTFLIGRHISDTLWVPFLAAMALATHLTFSAYATGGLETSLQTAMVLIVYYNLLLWKDNHKNIFLRRMGYFSALALLTRLDSSLLLYPGYIFLLFYIYEQWDSKNISLNHGMHTFLIAAGIPTIAVLLLLLFCHFYYGYALPNTFYIKLDSKWHIANGIQYFISYFKSQFYEPILLIVAWILSKSGQLAIRWRFSIMFLSVLILWIFYIFYIGGDFMEYRLLVPIMPFFYLMVCEGIIGPKLEINKWKILFICCAVSLGSFVHASKYYYLSDYQMKFAVVTIGMLNAPITEPPVNWTMIGKRLHDLFYTGEPSDVKIATTASGAIPYYSELPAVDQLGLNTRDIAEWGKSYVDRPGHRIKISTEYLRQEGVNIVIDHPIYPFHILNCNRLPNNPFHQPIRDVPMLFIPFNGRFLVTYYLNPHPRVEELIAERKIFRCTK